MFACTHLYTWVKKGGTKQQGIVVSKSCLFSPIELIIGKLHILNIRFR